MVKVGTSGHGKSRMLIMLNKPKWMPMWLHHWRERRAWVRWGKTNTVIFALPELNPEDLAIPMPNGEYPFVTPRSWPSTMLDGDK